MAVDPNTGRIITSSSLTIAEADSKRVPRNQALGPSRTAQERKQFRTALLAAWDGLADNPVIADLIDTVEQLEQERVNVYTIDSTDGGYFAIPLPRVEDENGDPRYYAIDYHGSLNLGAENSGAVDFRFDFDGLLETHALAFEVWTSTSPNGDGSAADFWHQGNQTPGDVEFSTLYDAGTTYLNVRITGRIAPISENFTFDLIITTDALLDVLSGQDRNILRTQLTDQAFS